MSKNLIDRPAVESWQHPDAFHVVVGHAAPRAKLTRELRHELIARHNTKDETVDVVRVTTDTLKHDGYLSVWVRSRVLDTLPVRAGSGGREAVLENGYRPTTKWTDDGVGRVAGVAFA